MNIRARHHLILPAIGVHEREQYSYELATSLLYILPCVVIFSAILDQIFITIYMNWVHPWRGIVQNNPQKLTEDEAVDQEIVANAIRDTIPLLTLNLAQDETEDMANINQT